MENPLQEVDTVSHQATERLSAFFQFLELKVSLWFSFVFSSTCSVVAYIAKIVKNLLLCKHIFNIFVNILVVQVYTLLTKYICSEVFMIHSSDNDYPMCLKHIG